MTKPEARFGLRQGTVWDAVDGDGLRRIAEIHDGVLETLMQTAAVRCEMAATRAAIRRRVMRRSEE